MKTSQSFEVKAPRERVFEYLSEPEKMKQWAQGMEAMTYVSGGPKQVGTRFKQQIREGGRLNEYEGEVLAFEPPTHSRVRMARSNFSITVEYRLSEVSPGVTRIDQTVEVESGSAVMRFIGKLFAPFTRSLMRKQMQKFQELVEKGA